MEAAAGETTAAPAGRVGELERQLQGLKDEQAALVLEKEGLRAKVEAAEAKEAEAMKEVAALTKRALEGQGAAGAEGAEEAARLRARVADLESSERKLETKVAEVDAQWLA